MGLGSILSKITGANDFDESETSFVDDTPTVSNSRHNDDYGYVSKANSSKVLSIAATTHLQVIVFKPQRFNESAEIANHFKNKKTIVLNLESIGKDDANRLLDFLGGVAYATDGGLKRISNTTYMIVPYDVDISGDTIEELESSSDLF